MYREQHDSNRYIRRAAVAWIVLAAAEVLHGTLRALFLRPLVGDLASRQIGVFSGSLLILVLAFLLMPWVGVRRHPELRIVGALWLVLMLAFEVALGRLFGMSWSRIAADYDPFQGGFMLLGMLVLLFAPTVAVRLRPPQSREGEAR